jgi:hypothetical protein
VQLAQLLFRQTWPAVVQFVARRQLPAVHPPERQSWPEAHCPSAVQSAHMLLVQTRPLLQSLFTWQLPATQVALAPLPTQTRPVPHCASPVQGAHTWLALQTRPPVVHSVLSWQVPITQLFETQM